MYTRRLILSLLLVNGCAIGMDPSAAGGNTQVELSLQKFAMTIRAKKADYRSEDGQGSLRSFFDEIQGKLSSAFYSSDSCDVSLCSPKKLPELLAAAKKILPNLWGVEITKEPGQ